MKFLATLILLFPAIGFAQQMPEQALSRKLDSLVIEDQKWRRMHTLLSNGEIPDTISDDAILSRMIQTDSLNYFEIKKIFLENGFPGISLVGKTGARNFWLLVQHQDAHPEFQDSVLVKMKTEVDKKNASSSDYAYLVDRVKINSGQLQVYGTQIEINEEGTSFIPKKVIEPEMLNERRAAMGLGSIEKYIEYANTQFHGSLIDKK